MGIFRDRSLLKTPISKTEEIPQPAKSDSPPPEYRVDQLPQDDLVASVRRLNLTKTTTTPNSNDLPTNDECIAHLKLLAAFANLREEIAESDGLFAINDTLASSLSSQSREQLIVKLREKRWAVYVTRALDRFQKWWETLLPSAHFGTGEGGQFSMQDVLQSSHLPGGTFNTTVLQVQPLTWKAAMLPPLDVLMVLHTFMLNPRVFLEDCIRRGKLPLWHAGFPWALVNDCIDNETFEYRAPQEAVGALTDGTGLSWDNLEDPVEKTMTCPNCAKPVQCPYTETTNFDPFQPFEQSTGFADKSFMATCNSCSIQIVHESLRIRKFRSDMQQLMKYNIPMPGTLLSLNGIPESVTSSADPTKHEVFFPNRLILAGLYTDLVEQTDPSIAYDFDRVRKSVERGIQDRSLVTKANKTTISKTLKRGEKIAVRRMMSRYWENSSPFALDLIGAVLRQGVFVDKMKTIDWIHSPALESTMTRLVKKYTVFFAIMAQNPGRVAVPTLDVDLAWHTHQLSPAAYAAYATAHCNGEFIDHDDKIEENKLSTAFEWTSKRYQKLTGGDVYSECTCWYCEAVRESHNHQSLISSSETARAKAAARTLHDRPGISPAGLNSPDKNPHISAHNAVRTDSSAGARIAARQQYKLERDYERAVKRAKGTGKTPPARDAYAYNYVWGYPMYMPVYYPYAATPCISGDMYACNPVGISTSYGSAGNCVSGSCGGAVAAGGCASGSGGCGSVAAGSCGGAGASGGGGGCAGGGGGGGGCGGGGGGGGCGGGGGA